MFLFFSALYIFSLKMEVLLSVKLRNWSTSSEMKPFAFLFVVYSSSNIPCLLSPFQKLRWLYAITPVRTFQKKTNVLKASWKPHTFFVLFFLKRYTILACVLTSPSPLRAGNSAIRYGFYTLDRTVKIFICLSLNVLLKSFICKVYSFYYIDTSVLLENIPLIKFIKTTYGTRVVYFP